MRIKPHYWVILILSVIIAIVLWQRSMQRHALTAVTDRADASVQTNHDTLQLGQLTLKSCEIGSEHQVTVQAYCTEFAVPEDHADANSRPIKLKVAVVKSEAAQPDGDLVTFIDGGPGGAATEDFPAVATALEPLLKHHHILLVDQRGTGGSNALDCPQLSARSKQPSSEQPSAEQLEEQNDKAKLPGLLRECLQEITRNADPQFYSTSDAILDLEAIRVALGGSQLNLLGVSYGTRVAQQYAMRYPQAVRSIVLDSAVPNSLALGQDHARNLDTALKAQFERCRTQAECAQRFPDSYQQLMTLRDRLTKQAITVQVPDPHSYVTSQRKLTATRLAGLVRLYAYNSATSALLPLMIDEATRGNYAPLLGQEQLMSDDVNERLTGGMGLSVGCTEDADLLQIRDEDEHSLLGNSLVEFFQTACAVWPHRARTENFHQAFKSSIPTLILSGEFDPVTPPRYADEIKAELEHARVLSAPGQGHAVIGARCMPRLVSEFVEKLQPDKLDAHCLQQLKPIPAFLDYNGASP
jgi:pimeloyl-ACP methyl ester carboxylesterase